MRARRLLALPVVVAAALAVPAAAAPPEKPAAGDRVSYEDQAFDAYRVAGDGEPVQSPSNPLVSQAPLDIRRVEWAPIPGTGYLTAITVTGAADEKASYVSFGEFTAANGERCQLYHFLTPGITAYANAFCGTAETGRRFVGRVFGSPVQVTALVDGGTRLAAAFDNSRLPTALKRSGRTLDTLSAYTCMSGLEGLGCRPQEKQDTATSSLTYRV